eukprot:GEMP01025897.1.p1 GENE.GEMP01025897.1~~GEMP01025897.1.p1  ORF type:complete len:523 (+),score=95.36 GEMP01025897.1:63-1571(+)
MSAEPNSMNAPYAIPAGADYNQSGTPYPAGLDLKSDHPYFQNSYQQSPHAQNEAHGRFGTAPSMALAPIPVYCFEGGCLDGSDHSYWDLCDRSAGKGLPSHQPTFEPRADLSRGFSFAAEISWDRVRQWSRIFDFGKDAGSTNFIALNWDKEPKMGLVVCAPKQKLGHAPDFQVDWGQGEIYGMHLYSDAAQPSVGYASCWLWTVEGSTGRMSIFKDGNMVGEKRIMNYNPNDTDRTKFLIGKSWWKIIHNHPNDNFQGSITNIKIWDRCVTWEDTYMRAKPLSEVHVAIPRISTPAQPQPPVQVQVQVQAPAQQNMHGTIGIRPNTSERVMIELHGWNGDEWAPACNRAVPPELARNGVTEALWREVMDELRSTQAKACLCPVFHIYVLYIIVFVLTIGRVLVLPLLVAAMLPLGWCMDVHQMFLKLFLRHANSKLAPYGVYVKFQNIKKDFEEQKWIMFAFTPAEIDKLKREPIFQRGTDMYRQEHGSAAPCPIDSHRVL